MVTPGVDVEALIKDVDKLELDSYAGRVKLLRDKLDEFDSRLENGQLRTEDDTEVVKKGILAVEKLDRVKFDSEVVTFNSGQTQEVGLAHSYTLIRNLVRIDQHPIYKKALEEWATEAALFESRVERKTKRSEGLKEEIYSVIGFYSVFQGVLLTATSQSSYLHCLNVGVPIALSLFASVGTLAHICKKFHVIKGLQDNIDLEGACLKEVKARAAALKEQGPEGFRFYDFAEDKERRATNRRSKICGLGISFLVPVAILLFSLVFLIAHPLILCRPGPANLEEPA